MNENLWSERSGVSEENAENVKYILQVFDDIINGLLLLEDHNYLFSNLGSSELERNYYFDTRGPGGGFVELAEELELLRSVLIGGALDWLEIKRSLN